MLDVAKPKKNAKAGKAAKAPAKANKPAKAPKSGKSLIRLGASIDALHSMGQSIKNKKGKEVKKQSLRLRGAARQDFAKELNNVVAKSIKCIAESSLPVFKKGKNKGSFKKVTLGGNKKNKLAIKSDKCFP